MCVILFHSTTFLVSNQRRGKLEEYRKAARELDNPHFWQWLGDKIVYTWRNDFVARRMLINLALVGGIVAGGSLYAAITLWIIEWLDGWGAALAILFFIAIIAGLVTYAEVEKRKYL